VVHRQSLAILGNEKALDSVHKCVSAIANVYLSI